LILISGKAFADALIECKVHHENVLTSAAKISAI